MTLAGLLVTFLVVLATFILIMVIEIRHDRYLAKLDKLDEIDQLIQEATHEYNGLPKKRHLTLIKR